MASGGFKQARTVVWRQETATAISLLFGIVLVLAPIPSYAQCTISNPCTAAPIDLGTFGGTQSQAWGVSSDGFVVVGSASFAGNAASHAFRWTSPGGMQDLGTLGGTHSAAFGVSGDGSVVVGSSYLTAGGLIHAFRWTSSGGMQDLGTLGGTSALATAVSSEATGVNSDGSVVVGYSLTTGNVTYHAFRWTSSGGMQDLGTLGGTFSRANGVSSDGSVIVGESYYLPDVERAHAFRWTSSSGMQDLGTLGGTKSIATAVNADGSVVVGESSLTTVGPVHAFRWTSSGGMQDLGTLVGGTQSQAWGVSGDGSVVVGEAATMGSTHAFRWTAATGMKDLNTLLATAGINMTGIALERATGVSTNGQFIVGFGFFSEERHGFIVRYDDGTGSVIAGLTNVASVSSSIDQLADARLGLMAQQHGFASPLLGGDKPMGLGNEAGVFASVGSAAGGGFTRYSFGSGFSMLGGLSYAKESYPDADLKHGGIGALALQYIYGGWGRWRPFVETGSWIAPNAALSFSRTYANGAGTATGTGDTHGDLSYVYARAGLLVAQSRADQVAVSAEYGRERMTVNAYTEPLSAQNPFEAHVAAGTDVANLGKLRLQWSHQFTSNIDGTLWVAGVRSFNRSSDLTAFVPGIGTLKPTELGNLNWAEYGARIGYKLTDTVTLDAFANGVSGHDSVATRVHMGLGLRLQF